MLRARDELVGRAVVGALRRLHARGREHGAEVRILAAALRDATPARLVRDVDHRRVRLLEPDGGRLAGAERGVVRGHLRVEARGRRRAGSGRSCGSRGSCRRRTGAGCAGATRRPRCVWSSRMRTGSVTLRTEPRPARTPSSVTMKSGSSLICCSFSSRVICASSAFTRPSTPRSGACRVGCSTASSLERVPATTPPTVAVPAATSATAIAAFNLSLAMGRTPSVGAGQASLYPGSDG